MLFTLIRWGLVNIVSHLVSIQSSELIIALVKNYASKERVVKSITREIILDLRPKNIEKVFHLLKAYQYIRLTYYQVETWYRDHEQEATKIIQSSYLIDRTPTGRKVGKVDMTRDYMKDDIRHSIVLLRNIMGLSIARHLNIWMVHFIETMRMTKMPISMGP